MSTTLSLGLASALLPEHVSRTLAPTETPDEASHLLMEGVQALRGRQQHLTPPPALTSAVSLRSRPLPAVGEPSGTADAALPIRVFVLPVPQSLTSDLLHCYQNARGQWPWDDSVPHGDCDTHKRRTCKHCDHGNACSESLGVEVAQHASDIWLHKALLAHPGRTQIASEADVILVPFYGGISYASLACAKAWITTTEYFFDHTRGVPDLYGDST